MTTQKKITLAAIVLLMMLPAIGMSWAAWLLGVRYDLHSVLAAVAMFVMGGFLTAAVADFMK